MPARRTVVVPVPVPMAPTKRTSRRDHELSVMQKIFAQIATLPPAARMRVLGYVCARAETLPVLAAVSGGTDDEQPSLPLNGEDDADA